MMRERTVAYHSETGFTDVLLVTNEIQDNADEFSLIIQCASQPPKIQQVNEDTVQLTLVGPCEWREFLQAMAALVKKYKVNLHE